MAAPMNLEPAERDPRKLRTTAWVLLTLMLLSGVGIFYAYLKFTQRAITDTRPSYENRLFPHDLKVRLQDGTESGLLAMDGKVWVAASICAKDPDSWLRTREVMQRLQKRYADRADFRLVCLTVDPEKETPDVMAETAKQAGASLPQWWFAAPMDSFAGAKYLKNNFKQNLYPHKVGERWMYDSKVMVIDRNLHVRKAVVKNKTIDFNFDEAARLDQGNAQTGKGKTFAELLEEKLTATIDELLAEPTRGS